MKTLFAIFLASVIVLHAGAQVTLDKKYEHSCVSTLLTKTEYKLYLMDQTLKQCRIYNVDHSLYKTINLSVPTGSFLYDIRFVTKDLFNNDDKVELLYTYYNYTSTSTASGSSSGTGYYTYTSKIINEDGALLTSIEGGLYSYLYRVSDEEYKLFAYCYDYSVTPNKLWTNIYSIPGQPFFLGNTDEQFAATIENAYPNPSFDYTTVGYNLPGNVLEGHLTITDMGGKNIAEYRIDKNFDNIKIETGRILPGTYLYYISAEEFRSEAKKLIIK